MYNKSYKRAGSELLAEFDNKIFNWLIDRIEVLESTNFVLVLRNGIRVEKVI